MKRMHKIELALITSIALLQITSCTSSLKKETVELKETLELTETQKPTETQKTIETQEIIETSEPIITPEPTAIPEDSYATIVSFGDTLCHKPVYNAAYNKEIGIYEFSPMLNT